MSGIDPFEQHEEAIRREGEFQSSPSPSMESGPQSQEAASITRPPLVPRPRRPFPLHPNFGWAILWCIGMLLVTQVPGGLLAAGMIVAGMILFPNSIRRDDIHDTASLLRTPLGLVSFGIAIFVAHALMIGVSLIVLRIVAGRDWMRQVAIRLPSWKHVVLIVLVWPAFSFLANGIGHVIQQYLHVPSLFFQKGGPGESMDQVLTGWVLVPAVFLIAVMPAFSEELWCRAFLGRGLVGKHGLVLGVLGTSFLFGVIHVDPAQGLVAMAMGVGLHYFYLTTRSLLIPMLMHFLNNALAVILPNIPNLAKLGQDENQGDRSLALYTGAIVLVFGVCWALYQSRPRLTSDGTGPSWQQPYPGVAMPPQGSGTHVETPRLSEFSLALVGAGAAAFAVGVMLTMQRIS
jgi:membrane protease YdiL (CAAX protease family)